MEWLTDPTTWLGLATLILLEIVLGIDNLVFLAILSDKVPPNRRNAARQLGLGLALLIRLALLAGVFWLTTLTQPCRSFRLSVTDSRGAILFCLPAGYSYS